MKYALRAGLVLATTAVSAAVLTAPAYAHAAPFTVKAGSAPAGTTVAVTATSGSFTIKDTTSRQPISCNSTTVHGTVRAGSNGMLIGALDGSTAAFTCIGPGPFHPAFTGYGSWNVNVRDAADGSATGTVTGLRVHGRFISGPACDFDVAANAGTFKSSGTSTTLPGTVAYSFTNSSQLLTVPPSAPSSLGLWNVKGTGTNTYCIASSIFNEGDQVSLQISWKLTADNGSFNPVTIS